MKRALGFGFLFMGYSFAITQGVLIHELPVAFSGNELSIGLIPGSWLHPVAADLEGGPAGEEGNLRGPGPGQASEHEGDQDSAHPRTVVS